MRVALHFIEDNLPAGEEGIYAVVNNAGVSIKIFLFMILCWFFPSQVCVCGEFDWQTWDQVEKQVRELKRKKFQLLNTFWSIPYFASLSFFPIKVEVNLLGSLRVTKLSLPLLKRWWFLHFLAKPLNVIDVSINYFVTFLCLHLSLVAFRCVGGGRIINVSRYLHLCHISNII